MNMLSLRIVQSKTNIYRKGNIVLLAKTNHR